jgi:hypothetical protein
MERRSCSFATKWITGTEERDEMAVPGWWTETQTPARGGLPIAFPHQCHPLLEPTLQEFIEIKKVLPFYFQEKGTGTKSNQLFFLNWDELTKEEERENDPDSVVPSSIATQGRSHRMCDWRLDWSRFLEETAWGNVVEFGLVADRRSLRAKGKVVPFGQLLEGKGTGQERGNSSHAWCRRGDHFSFNQFILLRHLIVVIFFTVLRLLLIFSFSARLQK